MYKRTLVSFAALGAFTVLAFGSMSGGTGGSSMGLSGGGQGNADACAAYVEHFNNLDCIPEAAHQEVDTTCSGQADIPADTAPLWECMTENASCVDGRFDAGNQSDCAGKVTY